jgi:hypothetical protein
LQVAMEKNHKSCNLDRFMNLLQGVHTVVNIIKKKNLLVALSCTFLAVLRSVSGPDPVGSAFKLGLDPDPYSESGSGSQIQMSKKRLKKAKIYCDRLYGREQKNAPIELKF